jgi:LmbE family N-acetylglucosaminyl deacetylase
VVSRISLQAGEATTVWTRTVGPVPPGTSFRVTPTGALTVIPVSEWQSGALVELYVEASRPGVAVVQRRSSTEGRLGRLVTEDVLTVDVLPPMRKRSARPIAAPLNASNILFFGAHPDDEILAAPLLGEGCAALGRPCTLVSATKGEAGECLRREGCLPSLAEVRSAELDASARLLGMTLSLGSMPDGSDADPERVLENWSAVAAGREQLIEAAIHEIVSSNADVVITFNPAHGSTGHPDHKAVGQLVLAAAGRLGERAPAVYFLETLATISDDGMDVTLERSPFASIVFDATQPLSWRRNARWDMMIFAAQLHRSQFPPALITSLALQPTEKRVVWLSGPY